MREPQQIIDDMRNIVKPYISHELRKLNYEVMGESDRQEFENEFDFLLELAERGSKYSDEYVPFKLERTIEEIKDIMKSLIDVEEVDVVDLSAVIITIIQEGCE